MVAEELHFGHAAQRLNMLPTTLGRQIKLLEQTLGTALLVRSTRHVALTPAGDALRRGAQIIFQEVDATERAVRQLSKVRRPILRIGAIDSAAVGLLPSFIRKFRNQHPDTKTQIIQGTSAQQIQFLLSGRLDVAFVRLPVRAEGLQCEFLLRETLVVAMRSDHPLAMKLGITVHDLVDAPLIIPTHPAKSRSYKIIMRAFEAAGIEPKIVLDTAERQTIISLVEANVGIALLSNLVANIPHADVVYRPLKIAPTIDIPHFDLGIAWVEGSHNTQYEQFVNLVRHDIRDSVEDAACPEIGSVSPIVPMLPEPARHMQLMPRNA